jgi:hypothetical protein
LLTPRSAAAITVTGSGKQLDRAGVTYCFVEAQASTDLLKRRLKEREGKSDEVSDARFEDFEMIDRFYEVPSELGAHQLIAVQTVRPLELSVTEALKALTQGGARETKRS